jgi:propionyl-CoA synthetase
VIAYKPLLDEALRVARHQPLKVVLLDRGLAPHDKQSGRDLDWAGTVRQVADRDAPVCWLESNAPSYILYTSGTTGRPKGVLRDTGGYAVALATSMRYIFEAQAGDVFFATSDIGWVVGHSYIVYGPLIAGMTTVLCEGLPTHPDPGVWWRTVDRFRVNRLFSSPTAIRVLKKFGDAPIRQSDLGSLRGVYLAGEPLDQPTSQWIADALEVPVTDNYWQTETGWPILALPRGVTDAAGARPPRLGSPGVAMPGFDVKVIPETGTAVCADGDKGIVMIAAPLPPGCMQSVWGDDARFLETYWSRPLADDRWYYSTFDWGVKDGDGYHFILGRTDDVINVAGHRLGTREIEECLCAHALVAEAAVVGVKDEIKGQVAVAFVVLRQTDAPLPDLEKELLTTVDRQLGPVARPARVHRVSALPKTRSGKVLRRVIQALCEGRDAGDVATLEDPSAVAAIAAVVGQPAAHAAWST